MTTVAVLGATGRTGRLFTTQALARGVKVRALARDPAALAGLELEVVKGDVRDPAVLRQLFEGVDAVVSALGPRTLRSNGIQSVAMVGVVTAMHAAGVRRYVALTSAAAVLPGEARGLGFRAALGLSRVLFPGYVADKRAEVAALVSSDLEWTLVRVPGALGDGEGGELDVSLEPKGMRPAQRQAVARLLLDAVLERQWVRQAPFAAGAAKKK